MSNTFYISDHHFYHFNIIAYCNRPFKNLEEMNNIMIQRWNAVVSPKDTVIFGGDLALSSMRNYKRRVTELLATLNGIKILVRGNHDRSHTTMRKLGFYSSNSYFFENNILVVHNLLRCWDKVLHLIQQANYVLHGHIHHRLYTDTDLAIRSNKFINICVEHLQYTPHTLFELSKIRDIQTKKRGL